MSKSQAAVILGLTNGQSVCSVHLTHQNAEAYHKRVVEQVHALGFELDTSSTPRLDTIKHASGGSVKFVAIGQQMSGYVYDEMVHFGQAKDVFDEEWVQRVYCRLPPTGKKTQLLEEDL